MMRSDKFDASNQKIYLVLAVTESTGKIAKSF
jgi:hypothetical protein